MWVFLQLYSHINIFYSLYMNRYIIFIYLYMHIMILYIYILNNTYISFFIKWYLSLCIFLATWLCFSVTHKKRFLLWQILFFCVLIFLPCLLFYPWCIYIWKIALTWNFISLHIPSCCQRDNEKKKIDNRYAQRFACWSSILKILICGCSMRETERNQKNSRNEIKKK